MDRVLHWPVSIMPEVIGLAMNEEGIKVLSRVALAMELVANCDAHGVPIDNLI